MDSDTNISGSYYAIQGAGQVTKNAILINTLIVATVEGKIV